MKKINITNDLKGKLLSLSMAYVSQYAFDFAKNVYEDEYYYLVEFDTKKDKFCLLSKDSKDYMLHSVYSKECSQYNDWKSEMYEIIDGFYTFIQYQTDSEFAMTKMNYWVNKRKEYKRDILISKLLEI